MSRENVEIVRQVYEAAGSRDREKIMTLYDPKVELDASRLVMGGGIYRGHAGLIRFFRQWNEAWAQIEYDYEQIDAGPDQVISIVTGHARGRASGVEAEMQRALLWTVRDSSVIRLVWFESRTDAFHAARAVARVAPSRDPAE